MSEFEELAKQKAKRAWVERGGKEKGNLPLTKFEISAEETAFERWWDANS